MGTQAVSPYQQVIEKTKNLAFRSQVLAMNIEKKLNAKNTEVSIHIYVDHKINFSSVVIIISLTLICKKLKKNCF